MGTGYSVFLSAISLLMFNFTSSWGIVVNSVFLFVAGAFNCGPDSILGELLMWEKIRSLIDLLT